VTATLKATQAKYAEGIMTYADGEFLHHYLTIKNTMTEAIRGDQEQAVRELYALLLHTSSTHAGFEFAILPWGDRNFEDNLAPHGWFAAEYRTLLRTMRSAAPAFSRLPGVDRQRQDGCGEPGADQLRLHGFRS
jgi:hypothetical protein